MKQTNDLERVSALLKAGDQAEAVHVASGIKLWHPWRDPIQRAWSARTRPDFYREIGQDPAELIRAGDDCLRMLVAEFDSGRLFRGRSG